MHTWGKEANDNVRKNKCAVNFLYANILNYLESFKTNSLNFASTPAPRYSKSALQPVGHHCTR